MERIDGRIIHDVYLDRVVFRETFTGDGSDKTFTLSGPDATQVTFKYGAWAVGYALTTFPAHITSTAKKPIYDSIVPLTRNRVGVSSINATTGVVTLDYAPRNGVDFYVWYWYDLPNHHLLEDYYREDFVASMEEEAAVYGDEITVTTTNFAGIFTSADNTVQKALDTADDHLHAGQTITPTGITLDANGVVGVTDGNPQIVFDNTNNWLEITGNVGINKTDPGVELDIGGAYPTLRLSANSGGSAGFQFYHAGAQKWNYAMVATSQNFALWNNGGTNKHDFYITHSTGRVGFGGVTDPQARLHVDQSSTTAAIPVLTLDQGDVSEQCIKFSSDATDRDIHLFTVDVTGTPAVDWDESEDAFSFSKVIRGTTSLWYDAIHVSAFSCAPGVSGASCIPPDGNTLGGYRLSAAAHTLYLNESITSTWDGASDISFRVTFEVNVDNTGGTADDTVDLKLVCYYKGNAETANKTQTLTTPTNTVGQSPRYKRFTTVFTINWDEAGNIVEVGDKMSFLLNCEASGDVTDIIVNTIMFRYPTAKINVEV